MTIAYSGFRCGCSVGVRECPEHGIARQSRLEGSGGRLNVCRRREHRAYVLEQRLVRAPECLPLNPEAFLDAVPEGLDPVLAHRDLDARLELVIAAPDGVVDLQDGLDVGKQVRLAAGSHE